MVDYQSCVFFRSAGACRITKAINEHFFPTSDSAADFNNIIYHDFLPTPRRGSHMYQVR